MSCSSVSGECRVLLWGCIRRLSFVIAAISIVFFLHSIHSLASFLLSWKLCQFMVHSISATLEAFRCLFFTYLAALLCTISIFCISVWAYWSVTVLVHSTRGMTLSSLMMLHQYLGYVLKTTLSGSPLAKWKISVLRVARPKLNLLVSLELIQVFWKKDIILCILIFQFFLKCVPTLPKSFRPATWNTLIIYIASWQMLLIFWSHNSKVFGWFYSGQRLIMQLDRSFFLRQWSQHTCWRGTPCATCSPI